MPEEQQNIDQIREIILGPHLRDVERRLDAFGKALQRLEKEISKSLNSAETSLRQDLEKSAARWEESHDTTLSKLTAAEKAQQKEDRRLERRLDKFEKASAEKLSKEIGKLEGLLRSLQDDTDEAFSRIGTDKASKEEIAELLAEVGMRLKGQDPMETIRAGLSAVRKDETEHSS